MNKRHIKLIMELIFIFIIPLLFICFTSEIQVERNFEYDNNGNYETSAETKNLSFDNSIIKYQKEIKKYSLMDYIKIDDSPVGAVIEIDVENMPEYYYTDRLEQYLNLFYFDIDDEYGLQIDMTEYNNPYDITVYVYSYNENVIVNPNGFNDETNLLYTYNNNRYEKNNELNANKIVLVIEDYKELILNNYTYDNSILYEKENVKTIWGNIKQLLIDNLDLNDNVLLEIVLCYMILWVIHWIIWHIFYGFLELIIHIIPRKWEKE